MRYAITSSDKLVMVACGSLEILSDGYGAVVVRQVLPGAESWNWTAYFLDSNHLKIKTHGGTGNEA